MVLDLQLQSVEFLIRADDVSTALAYGETGDLALERTLAQVLLWSILEKLFEAIKAHIEELLSILLHSYISRSTAIVLKCEAKFDRVVLLTICELQKAEHFEPLVQ